jgi:hypothetical protein
MILTQMEAMGLTLVIESAAALALAPVLGLRPAACALSAILASTLTHPILWAIFYSVHEVLGPLTTPILEAIIVLAEAPFYRVIARTKWDDALLMSLLVNAASWGAGEAIYALA